MEKCFVFKIEFPRLLLVVEKEKSRWFGDWYIGM